jgi:sugar/nucleoside kinase (ribokinase family)
MGEIIVEIMRSEKNCPLDQPGIFKGPYPSGAPAIFISAAAQLGNQAKIWGGVGQDKFGDV